MLTASRTEEPSASAPDAGLPEREAQERLRRFGPNELPAARRESMLRRVGRQLREPMALLLMAAGLVSGLWLGERGGGLRGLYCRALPRGPLRPAGSPPPPPRNPGCPAGAGRRDPAGGGGS